MVLYLFGRVTGIGVVFVIVSILAFVLMHSVPGGPFDETNNPLNAEGKANILRKYGLDRPMYEQYFNYMGSALHGDFGISYQSPTESVLQLIGRAWPTSMQLGGMAILLAFTVGLTSGILAAVHQNTWIDYVVRAFSIAGVAMPSFWLGILIILGILITSKAWFGSPWMPPIKYVPIWVDPFYNLSMLIWPALATGYRYSAVATRMTRSAMLEVLREDYVRTARAKGVFQKLVIRRHALRNALLPVITVIGIEFAFLMGGLVVTEQVFNLNGLGKLFVESVSNQDYNMTQALVMLVVAIFALANLFVDVLYAWIDPRIRYNP